MITSGLQTAVGDAIEHLKTGVGDLRSLITDLRPAALDEFGIESALEALAARVTRQSDAVVDLEVDLVHDDQTGLPALSPRSSRPSTGWCKKP